MENLNIFTEEWVVIKHQGCGYEDPPFGVYTKNLWHYPTQQNGEPYKNSKPKQILVFNISTRVLGEHICQMHNLKATGTDEYLQELIKEKMGSFQRMITDICGTEQE